MRGKKKGTSKQRKKRIDTHTHKPDWRSLRLLLASVIKLLQLFFFLVRKTGGWRCEKSIFFTAPLYSPLACQQDGGGRWVFFWRGGGRVERIFVLHESFAFFFFNSLLFILSALFINLRSSGLLFFYIKWQWKKGDTEWTHTPSAPLSLPPIDSQKKKTVSLYFCVKIKNLLLL